MLTAVDTHSALFSNLVTKVHVDGALAVSSIWMSPDNLKDLIVGFGLGNLFFILITLRLCMFRDTY
jgi:hypothetical protein